MAWLCALGLTTAAWADVALLHENGPKSGSLASNLGRLTQSGPPAKVTMVSAEVKIHLRPGEGDQLAADCVADFVLENREEKTAGPRDCMVAFPVTGMSAKIVTISNFAVAVDGSAPGKIFQNALVISDKGTKQPGDVLLSGQLEGRLLTKDYKGAWGDDGFYQNAYVWTQKFTPGTKSRVRVTYTAALRPQPVRYTKSYSRLGEDGLIPFSDLNIDNWDDSYYFFDYILVSGSTWDGPIGRETIEFSADPALGLSMDRIVANYREPIGFWARWNPRVRNAVFLWLDSETPGFPRWIVSGKPQADYLFSIPVSALGKVKPVSTAKKGGQ